MEEQKQESYSAFGMLAGFMEDETNPLQIDDLYESEAEEQRKLADSAANIYQPVKEGTLLHRAIRKGDQKLIAEFLENYERDFDKIKDYLVSKYQWRIEDGIWLRKYNMIAVGEDQCRACKMLEKSSLMSGDLEKAVFVVLQIPVDGEEVAVIHSNSTNRRKVCEMVIELLPNGILSWNYTGLQQESYIRGETFMELAASVGRNNVISKLYELGAALSIPNHCPLIAACCSFRKNTIRWLLTEHFDNFDCTQKSHRMNAFLVLMQKKDVEILDYVLKKMIDYRRKYYNETESEAFEVIFHYEDKEVGSLSNLIHLRDATVREKIAEYVSHYKLNLSYQWKDVTYIVCLMRANIAVDYCWSEIRKNPQLLGLTAYGETTVLHELIRMGKIEALPEMYRSDAKVKQFFENDTGIFLLREMLASNSLASYTFILENHAEFLLNNLDKVQKLVVLHSCNEPEFYETHGDLLVKYFPMFEDDIHEARNKEPVLHLAYGLQPAFHRFNLEFDEVGIRAKDENQSLSSIRGMKDLTLLHYAVAENNKTWFVDLLESGCDIDTADDEGNLPIHYVRSVEMFNLIIEKHPDGAELVHRTNADGYTVLHKVCSQQMNRKLMSVLLERVIECGADVNQLTLYGENAAFLVGNCTGLDVLRRYNVNLEVVNQDGDTALDWHMRNRNSCMGAALLPLMSKLPSFKDHAHTYLESMIASNRDSFCCDYQPFLEDNPETTRIIFDALYQHSREEASRLFCLACCTAHIFAAEKFLEFGYDLDFNYKDYSDYTPIIGLCSYMERSNVHLMRQVLEKGVDLECRNVWGKTALLALIIGFRSAKWCGHDVGSVQLLLDHGAQINSTDFDGNTALHHAFENKEWELVAMLVENGADVLAKNKENKMPQELTLHIYQELFSFIQ